MSHFEVEIVATQDIEDKKNFDIEAFYLHRPTDTMWGEEVYLVQK